MPLNDLKNIDLKLNIIYFHNKHLSYYAMH